MNFELCEVLFGFCAELFQRRGIDQGSQACVLMVAGWGLYKDGRVAYIDHKVVCCQWNLLEIQISSIASN